MYNGQQNWMEIGNETNEAIVFFGRADYVEFCVRELLPTLCGLSERSTA